MEGALSGEGTLEGFGWVNRDKGDIKQPRYKGDARERCHNMSYDFCYNTDIKKDLVLDK